MRSHVDFGRAKKKVRLFRRNDRKVNGTFRKGVARQLTHLIEIHFCFAFEKKKLMTLFRFHKFFFFFHHCRLVDRVAIASFTLNR